MTLRTPDPEEFAITRAALRESINRSWERMRAHMAKEDGHDATYGCKRCEELSN